VACPRSWRIKLAARQASHPSAIARPQQGVNGVGSVRRRRLVRCGDGAIASPCRPTAAHNLA
jgi:hypothetical protein